MKCSLYVGQNGVYAGCQATGPVQELVWPITPRKMANLRFYTFCTHKKKKKQARRC